MSEPKPLRMFSVTVTREVIGLAETQAEAEYMGPRWARNDSDSLAWDTDAGEVHDGSAMGRDRLASLPHGAPAGDKRTIAEWLAEIGGRK